MKKGPSLATLINRINQFSPDLGGIFTFSDLWNLIGLQSSDRTAKVINRLVREGVFNKVRKGIYMTSNADLWILASRLKKGVCISMDSVLAKNALIGTIPAYSVSATYPGKAQTIQTPLGQLRYFKMQKELNFGTTKEKNGIIVADSEKAYLDLLYYFCKGATFVIDPRTDVSIWKLDQKKIKTYLKVYKNQKFRAFVEGLLRG